MASSGVFSVLTVRILVLPYVESTSSYQLAPIAKPNCETHCGDVSIPYPFGIGPNNYCYLHDWFEIECDNSTSPHKPFLRMAKLEVLNIDIKGTLRVNNPVTCFHERNELRQLGPNLTGSPFVYSGSWNRFTAVSCGFFAFVRSDDERVVGGCMSTCVHTTDYVLDFVSCDGINCCQTRLPPYLTAITTQLQSESDEITGKDRVLVDSYNYAFLVEQEWFLSNFSDPSRDIQGMGSVPVVLEWILSSDLMNTSLLNSYERFTENTTSAVTVPIPSCIIYSVGTSSTYNRSRIQCFCPVGFEGSPYLLQPCQDIDECQYLDWCMNRSQPWNLSGAVCKNSVGGYACYSHTRSLVCNYISYGGGGYVNECNIQSIPQTFGYHRIIAILLGLGMGLGVLLLIFRAWCIHKLMKKRREVKRKEMFFKRNGGLLLEQQLSTGKINIEKIKLFKSKELEKSTDNFNTNRILGHGSQGTVYKGMLADGRIVAVKKSKVVDEGKISNFINEVVILSQINHRNVVKIFGCCLETEVPLLVYEFIPNGTLSQYIQGTIEGFPLTWKMRLRIATEIAGALSYLHSAASFPIFHRDIKSSNILLDEKYRAKVADFGTSRSISFDQTHVTTLVNGTFGYLDPEFFQSNRFTEKSDVYSFGVVLVELLTGQKPICAVTSSSDEDCTSLATYFITSMQEDRLFDIVDARVLKDGSKTDIRSIANLARRCLNLNGRNRPTMREVTTELEAIQM